MKRKSGSQGRNRRNLKWLKRERRKYRQDGLPFPAKLKRPKDWSLNQMTKWYYSLPVFDGPASTIDLTGQNNE